MKNIVFSTTCKLTHILCSAKGFLKGTLALAAMSIVVFVILHYAKIPAGGDTTWIILGVLAIFAVARGIYVAKSELWRLEHYKLLG